MAPSLPPPSKTDSGYVDALASPEDVMELRGLLAPYPEAWVSFRADASLELDGTYSNDVTPEGIYALPVKTVMHYADTYAGLNRTGRFESLFHCIGYTRRPTAVVFEPSGRIVSTKGYDGFEEDYGRLYAYVEKTYPRALPEVSMWKPKHRSEPCMQSRALFWMAEKAADEITGAEDFGGYNHHPEKPRVWRELMSAMGIAAYEDRDCFVTGDCREQIVVFDPSSVEIVAHFANPASATPHRDIKLEGSRGRVY